MPVGVDVKDIAASVSTSLSQALQATNQYKSGSTYKVIGSGTLNVKLDELQTTDPGNAADAKAVAATAKSDSGPADASASLFSNGGASASGGGGIPTWAILGALGIGALAVVVFAVKK